MGLQKKRLLLHKRLQQQPHKKQWHAKPQHNRHRRLLRRQRLYMRHNSHRLLQPLRQTLRQPLWHKQRHKQRHKQPHKQRKQRRKREH